MAHRLQWPSTNVLIAILLLHSFCANAQSGDGGTADGFGNSNLGAAGTGAEGDSSSSANLSRGAIIAISVVVAVVVVGGVSLAVLFYLAKKRQWQVRKTIRRTATKAVRAMTPRTPSKMSFAPLSPKTDKHAPAFVGRSKSPDDEESKRDLEKGFTSTETRMDTPEKGTPKGRKERPERLLNTVLKKNANLPAPIQTSHGPSSHFEMDSPKSPMWTRVLGRK